MCGIIGYIGYDDAYDYILSGLSLLQNRGYDSAGICILTDTFTTWKFASQDALQLLKKKKTNGTIGIGHTRWATHGAKTDINAHPHCDSKGIVSIVHNGIIENYIQIKNNLLNLGYQFISQTDSEVIANLTSYYYSLEQDPEKALSKTFQDLQGTWAVVIIFKDHPNYIYLSKNGSPLVIGYDKNWGCIISSEQLPLSKYFSNYVSMNDGDIVSVHKQKDGIISFPDISNYSLLKIQNRVSESTPHPYEHWTLKEIYEQENSILRALNNGGRIENSSCVKLGGPDENIDCLKNIQTIIILGCGTSLYAGLVSSVIFKKMKCFDSIFCYDASEFTSDDIPQNTQIGFIVLSQSGETKDVHRCLKLTKNFPTISIINVVGSMIALESTCGIYLNAGRENAVASTKSFTSQIVVMTLLSVWFCQIHNKSELLRKQYITSLRNVSYQVHQILSSCRTQCQSIAQKICHSKTVFVLGRQDCHFLAKEAALKLKEISYINAEGVSAGSLKHGPFALIDKDTWIILIAPRDDNYDKMINTAEEIYARHANIIMITTDKEPYKKDLYHDIIVLPQNEKLNCILCIIPIQIIAYEIAILRKHNPDFPKNLAKVVTVDG